jgi:hypothetical protein
MHVARSYYGLGLLALVAVLLAGIAVTATIRTRRGIALTVLLVIVAAVYIVGFIANDRSTDPAYVASHPFAGLGLAITELVDMGLFFIGGIATLLTAAIARHWSWAASIVVAMLPMLALILKPIRITGYTRRYEPTRQPATKARARARAHAQ